MLPETIAALFSVATPTESIVNETINKMAATIERVKFVIEKVLNSFKFSLIILLIFLYSNFII
ncbi:hypothetical protein MCANUFG1_02775 [Mycoplasmopsis canis UFG1]|nr:hypothetical protein MCANUFG1_02775 [Mycoplasmopsis canis UFG1]